MPSERGRHVGFFTTEAIPFTERDAPKTRKATLARAKTLQAARTQAARRTLARQAAATRPADDFERIFVLGTRVTERPRGVTTRGVDPVQRLAQARATQRETEALRAIPFQQPPPLTPARGVPTTTQTFFPPPTPATREPQAFAVTSGGRAEDNIFDISFGEEPKKKKKKAKGKRPKPRGAGTEFDFDFGEFEDIFSGEIASGVTIGAAISESDLFEPFR